MANDSIQDRLLSHNPANCYEAGFGCSELADIPTLELPAFSMSNHTAVAIPAASCTIPADDS
jgi:hypothetical protein